MAINYAVMLESGRKTSFSWQGWQQVGKHFRRDLPTCQPCQPKTYIGIKGGFYIMGK